MLEDLEEDIQTLQNLLSVAPPGHVLRTETMEQLVQQLHRYFEITESVGDIREAIQTKQKLHNEHSSESSDIRCGKGCWFE